MTDYRDFSRLPDDPAYWEALEARVLAAARSAGPAAGNGGTAWSALAARAGTLGGLAAAAAIATFLLVPAQREAPDPGTITLLGSAITDATLARFVAAPAPPTIESLLVDRTREVSE